MGTDIFVHSVTFIRDVDGYNAYPFASGTLVRYRGGEYLITAAHVIQSLLEDEIHPGGSIKRRTPTVGITCKGWAKHSGVIYIDNYKFTHFMCPKKQKTDTTGLTTPDVGLIRLDRSLIKSLEDQQGSFHNFI